MDSLQVTREDVHMNIDITNVLNLELDLVSAKIDRQVFEDTGTELYYWKVTDGTQNKVVGKGTCSTPMRALELALAKMKEVLKAGKPTLKVVK